MSSVRKSLLISFAEGYAATILQFVSIMILSRILTPKEIGVFSIAMVFVNIAHILRDLGIGQYIVQEKELTQSRLRTAYGISILVAWVLAGVLALAAIPIADFYHEPGIREVIRVIVLNFVLMPFATVPLAMWRRDLNFVPRFFISTTGTVASAITSIILAYKGFSYLSLAWGSVAGITTSVVLGNLVFRPKAMPWLPGFREFRHLFAFTTFTGSASLVKELGTGAPDMIVGKTLGLTEVSLLSRGASLVQLFEGKVTSAILSVALPLFSKTYREHGDFNWHYKRAIEMLTGIAWPFFAVLAILAFPVIRILYGPQWDATIPILKILCLYGALKSLFVFGGQALLAVGAARQNFLFEVSVQPLSIALILAAAPLGLEKVAWAMVAVAVFATAISFWQIGRYAQIRVRSLVPAFARGLSLTVFSGALPLLITSVSVTAQDNIWLPVVTGGIGAAVGWLFGVFVLRHALRDEIASVVARLLRRKTPVTVAAQSEKSADGSGMEPGKTLNPRPAYRIDALDGLRGLAVLLLLTGQLGVAFSPFGLAPDLSDCTDLGILLFFTLSAFLLSLPLVNGLQNSFLRWQVWRTYLLRRFLRIYPLFLTALLISVASTWAFSQLGKTIGFPFVISPREVFSHLLLQDGKGILWSIPVAFKYYFLLPVAVWFYAVPLRRNACFCALATAAVIIAAFRLWPAAASPDQGRNLTSYLSVFLLGSYTAVLHVNLRERHSGPLSGPKAKILLELIAALTLFAMIATIPSVYRTFIGSTGTLERDYHNGFLYQGILWSVFLLSMLHGTGVLRRILGWKVLRYLVFISFSVYLWHTGVFEALTHVLPPTEPLLPVAAVAALLLISALSYRLIERPLLRYGARRPAPPTLTLPKEELNSLNA